MKEKFINLLISTNQTQFPREEYTKINIHLPIRGDAQKYIIELNSKIRKLTFSEIDFSPNSFQIPHLTLYMGYVSNENNFKNAMEKIMMLSNTIKPFHVSQTIPYLKPKRNYVFVDTQQTEQIKELKQTIKDFIGEYMIPLEWDVVAEIPHITVGYIKDSFEKVTSFLDDYPIGPSWEANALEVSFCGLRGSCLGAIKTFEIK